MLMYWILFFVPAYFALQFPFQYHVNIYSRQPFNLIWKLMMFFLILVIGYRYQVGGDWLNYMGHLYALKNTNFDDLNLSKEPAYIILTWLGNFWGGTFLFNCVGGFIFSWGLLRFCLNLRRPWLALTVAIPYIVIVVGMGYSRQAVSLGTFMLGLAALEEQSIFRYIFWIFIGYLFHHTSILLVPLVLWFRKQSARGENLLLFLISIYAVYQIYLFGVQNYTHNYIQARYNSAGALTRILMNFLPAVLYLLFKEKFSLLTPNQHKICKLFSYFSIGFLILYFISPSSTAVDRFALYYQPLQILVWSNIPDVWGKTAANNRISILLIISFYALVESVWLFWGHNAKTWLPYRFYWWEVLTDRIWMFDSVTQLI
jgi:hypothetical protein